MAGARYAERVRAAAILCASLLSTSAWADDCPAAVTAARKAADAQVKAGKARDAVAALGAIKDRCFAQLAPAAKLWLLSELAFAAHAAGDDKRCAEVIGEADDDAITHHPKVGKALLYNAGLCQPKEGGCDYQLDADEPVCKLKLALAYSDRNELTGYEAPRCEIAGQPSAVQLAPGACLVASAFQRRGEDDATCPVLQRIDAKGKKHPLTIEKGTWIASPSDCCALRDLRVKQDGGKPSILLGSKEISRDCFGGTAANDFLTRFELDGDRLVQVRDYSINWH